RKKLDTAVHAFGIFTEYDLIDWLIFATRVRDLITAIVQRIAGITFTRPHVCVEIEQLPQSYDGREIAQSFSIEFRTQFLFRFILWLAGDRAEQGARCVLERLHRALRKRVSFRAPKFPADIARHILGIEFHPIENDPRRFHYIVPHAVAWHPRNSVFSHRRATLSEPHQPASEPCSF